MLRIQLTERLAVKFQALANNEELPSLARLHEKDFTRNRFLTARCIFLLIMRGIRISLQLAIDDFMEDFMSIRDSVSKQALSKARVKFDPDVIRELFRGSAEEFNKCTDLKLWKDTFRVYAIDGSDVALENEPELRDYFGCSGSKKGATTGMLSICHDVENNYMMDASFSPYATSERDAARDHIDAIMSLPTNVGTHNLFLMDRGYPSAELMAELIDKNQFFLMRVRRKFNLDFDAVGKDEEVSLLINNKTYRIRVIKIILSTGEVETLATNLPPDVLSYEEAGELYFCSWKIEVKYDSIKNKLQLENFSGRTVVTVMQDFWATMYLANLVSSVAFQTNDAIEKKNEGKTNKYQQTTNESILIHKLRRNLYRCLLEPDEGKRNILFSELVEDIARHPQQIKP